MKFNVSCHQRIDPGPLYTIQIAGFIQKNIVGRGRCRGKFAVNLTVFTYM